MRGRGDALRLGAQSGYSKFTFASFFLKHTTNWIRLWIWLLSARLNANSSLSLGCVTVTGWYRPCLLALDSAQRSFGLWSRETPHLAELPCVTSIFSTGRRLLTWSVLEKVWRFGICWAAGEVLRWRGEKLPLFRVLEWLQHIRRFTFSCSYSAIYARRQCGVLLKCTTRAHS